MTRLYWQRQKRLDSLFDKVGKIQGDEELVAHLAKYLCVLVSGYLETAVRDILSNYAQKKSHKYVASYVSKQLGRFKSPSMENIVTLVGFFSQDWKENLEESVEDELKDGINSIVANRHCIAHGIDVSITYGRISDYYKKALRVIAILEKQCGC
jgi:hypothetical protein